MNGFNNFDRFKEEKLDKLNMLISQKKTMKEISLELSISPDTLKRYMKILNINYHGKASDKVKLDDYLNNSVYITASLLRKKILESGLKEYRCECCGLNEWMGAEIPLELHHKNGNHYDNRIENLEILCSNCHSVKHGYSKYSKKCKNCNKEFLTTLKHQKFCCEDCRKEYNKKEEKICEQCGKKFYSSNKSQKFCSTKCSHEATKTHDINKEILLSDFLELKTYKSVGKKYGVSDKTIYKWCKRVGLPVTSYEMKRLLSSVK